MTTAILSVDLRVVTGVTAEEHVGEKVLAVRDMEASPSVIAALLRKAADDLDPPLPPRPTHRGGVLDVQGPTGARGPQGAGPGRGGTIGLGPSGQEHGD